MKMRFVPGELLSRQRRVRRAAHMVQRDRLAASIAYQRFKHEIIASPGGLAGFAALGFCLDRAGSGPAGGRGLVSRLSSLASLVFWARRLTAPTDSPGSAIATSDLAMAPADSGASPPAPD